MTGMQAYDNTLFWKEDFERDWTKFTQDLIRKRPFGDHKFYIFSFVKRVNDVTGEKKMFHHARLTKPSIEYVQPGTILVRADPRDPGKIAIIWTLPNQENFGLYAPGKMYADAFVQDCIVKFLNNPNNLLAMCEEEISDDEIREVYREKEAKRIQSAKLKNKIIPIEA